MTIAALARGRSAALHDLVVGQLEVASPGLPVLADLPGSLDRHPAGVEADVVALREVGPIAPQPQDAVLEADVVDAGHPAGVEVVLTRSPPASWPMTMTPRGNTGSSITALWMR